MCLKYTSAEELTLIQHYFSFEALVPDLSSVYEQPIYPPFAMFNGAQSVDIGGGTFSVVMGDVHHYPPLGDELKRSNCA